MALNDSVTEPTQPAPSDAYDRGWQDGYDERHQRAHADLSALRREVTKAVGPGFRCHACGRPIDEGGCQYRRSGGFMDTKVHLVDPSELARQFGHTPPIDTVGDRAFREQVARDRSKPTAFDIGKVI